MSLVLSLFPGIGLLDRAFEEEGFCIVRGPDLLWGGDIARFHPPQGRFEGVIGGPPCQAHSNLAFLVRSVYGADAVAADLIPEFARVVEEAQPDWFLMENVPRAPGPAISGYNCSFAILNNRWLGEVQNRKRKFSFGSRGKAAELLFNLAALEHFDWEPAVCATSGGRRVTIAIGGSGKVKKSKLPHETTRPISVMCELQGLPENFLEDSPFTLAGKRIMVGNGVPLPMGRAIARAVKEAARAAVQGERP